MPRQFGYMLQPQKAPNFPRLSVIVAPQSGQVGMLNFLFLHLEQVGIPALFVVVAGLPHTAHRVIFYYLQKKTSSTNLQWSAFIFCGFPDAKGLKFVFPGFLI